MEEILSANKEYRLRRGETNSKLISEAISQEQIATVRSRTHVGDEIIFTDDEGHSINGTVTAVYTNIFFLDNGRNYTWVQYLMGNSFLRHNIKRELDHFCEKKLYAKHEKSFFNYGRKGYHEHVQESPKHHKYVNRGKTHVRTTLSMDELDKLRKVMKGI